MQVSFKWNLSPSLAFKILIWIFATSTKIFTDKRFVGARTLDFEVIVASSYLSRRGPCPNSRV